VLEVTGRNNEQNRTKRDVLDEWVVAVNTFGGFGKWCWDVSFSPDDIEGIIVKHS
jgi:type III restriction enzyme